MTEKNETTPTNEIPQADAGEQQPGYVARAGAAGKALLVYLGTGSIGAALIAFLIFKGMGC